MVAIHIKMMMHYSIIWIEVNIADHKQRAIIGGISTYNQPLDSLHTSFGVGEGHM